MKILKAALRNCVLLMALLVSPHSFAYSSCIAQPEIQKAASKELLKLVTADESARENINFNKNDALKMYKSDLKRRIRVGELFAAGCFKTADDYYAAALIYQHGETPDHFYQAFIWSKRSDELGNKKAKHLSFLAIDRYLVKVGKKQLFGSQYYATEQNHCFCMQPVDNSFSENDRKKMAGFTLEERYRLLGSLNHKYCSLSECKTPLKNIEKKDIAKFLF